MEWQRTQTLYRRIRATGQLRHCISVAHSSESNRLILAANYQIVSAKSESSVN